MKEFPRRIRHIISELKDQYVYDDNQRPWIIGFSGGKDSTALLQLVWYALLELPIENRKRPVYVICNNTLVENPVIQRYVETVLKKIQKKAVQLEFPIFVESTVPRLEDTFWVNVIGRGYPVPNNAFRWCTDKMKIKPTSRFILERVTENGEAIVLIGTRSAESATRARSIKKHEIKGKRLTKHPHHPNTYVYSPIRDLLLEEVWYIINAVDSPWGADNSVLFQIYSDANADDYECPTMVTDDKHTACGQSRFGCWTCTVVREDKSLTAQVKKGQAWLLPLLELRSRLFDQRNMSKYRMPIRRNGKEAVSREGINQGAYTPEYRAQLLKYVLITQKKLQETCPNMEIISNQELVAIQVIWHRDLIFSNKVSDIYNEVFNKTLEMKKLIEKTQMEIDLLKSVCEDKLSDFELIQELLSLQKSKSLLIRKRGMKDDLERVIEKYSTEAV